MKQMLSEPPPAVVDLIAAWADAWNAHDMERARTLVAENVDFVTVAGLWLKGDEEFLAHHHAIHRAQMRDSRWTNAAFELSWMRDGLCLLHLEWTITGDRDANGTPRPRRDGLFTWLIECDGRTARILAAHNSNLRHDLRHRLAQAASGAEADRGDRAC
jgi:uncharacterized protein (TIGR02246 family)